MQARLSAAELSAETGVPLPTAQKLMGKLALAGLLTSARGAGGGFTLARPVTEISLADIVEAVEGPIALTMCSDGVNHDCVLDAHCRVKPHMGIVGNAVRGALHAVSLDSSPVPRRRPRLQMVPHAGDGVQVGEPRWAPASAGEQLQ